MRPLPFDPEAVALAEAASLWCIRVAEGDMSVAEQQAFEAWAGADPRHRAAFDAAVVTWQEVEAGESAPELLALRVEALEGLQQAHRRRWRKLGARAPLRLAAAAAGLVLMLGLGGSWVLWTPRVYQTGVGERRLVLLADGSRASLDADTRIEVRYSRDHRDIHLDRGRAKFDVAKDPYRPFAVAAADRVVVATGTQFSVELLSRKVVVVLYEGHVSVVGPAPGEGGSAHAPLKLANGGGQADQALTPGRELIASIAAPVAEVTATDVSRTSSWESGQLVFDNEPLAAAVEQVNRYSAEKLRVDDAIGRTPVNGVFDAGDTTAFIEGMTAVLPVKLVDQDGARTFVPTHPR